MIWSFLLWIHNTDEAEQFAHGDSFIFFYDCHIYMQVIGWEPWLHHAAQFLVNFVITEEPLSGSLRRAAFILPLSQNI